MNTCKECIHYRLNHSIPACRRYPTPVNIEPDDPCGEFEGAALVTQIDKNPLPETFSKEPSILESDNSRYPRKGKRH